MKFIGATVDQLDKTTKEKLNDFVPEIEKNYNLVTSSLITNDKEILGHSTKPVLHILPHGMDKIGKLNIKDGDLVMTEYPAGTASSKDRKRNTNRLTAAFAETLILFSSKKDGDINNLITNMLNLGKEIYCFPGDGSEIDGNSELIKQGANLITTIKDITK